MPVIEKILNGIMRYNKVGRMDSLRKLTEVNKNLKPKAVVISCMDARVIPNKFFDSELGDYFLVRNVGNMVPDAKLLNRENVFTEASALEFGCIHNDINDVIVCGHSDCKAVNMLYETCKHKKENDPSQNYLEAGLKLHSRGTIDIFRRLKQENKFSGPLLFEIENSRAIEAYIDPENKFSIADKFSQVNCLQQLQHISKYPFLKPKLLAGQLCLHAFWFDVHSSEVYMFSRSKKHFIPVNQDNFQHLLSDSREQNQGSEE